MSEIKTAQNRINDRLNNAKGKKKSVVLKTVYEAIENETFREEKQCRHSCT